MSLLDKITPVILTYNEEPNLGRCLDHLTWAKDIVVVDSLSEDRTKDICRNDPRVRLFERPFDCHAAQWNFAISETAIATPWVLALDADYMVPVSAANALASLTPTGEVCGFRIPFRYAVQGRVLRAGFYPPVVALFQVAFARYVQDGHTQRVIIDGKVADFAVPFVHDDRKSLHRWTLSQIKYAQLEARKLALGAKGAKSWIRSQTPLSPTLVGLYCLFARGAILEGRPGWLYAKQRMAAESLIGAAYDEWRIVERQSILAGQSKK